MSSVELVSAGDNSSLPLIPPDSPGSSVSSRLQDEYDELLKYALVVPSFQPETLPKTLTDMRQSFPQMAQNVGQGISAVQLQQEHEEEDEQLRQISADDDKEEDASEQAPDETEDIQSISDAPEPPAAGNSSTPNLIRVEKKQIHIRTTKETDHLVTDLFGERPGSPDSVSTISALGNGARHREEMEHASSVDPDIARMEHLLDQWTYDLKKKVLAEFGQSKIQMLEHHREQLIREKQKHSMEISKFRDEIEGLKELLHTYEQSIERKDQVISNLTHSLQKQQQKYELCKTFSQWKMRQNELKREAFATNLACRHYERRLSQKVWAGWHSMIESKWRQRVEKACQAKAQEVCMDLTNNYESMIASLNEALDAARTEVSKLHEERERYEETMKKAFMRGVCALNLEAMAMFHESENAEEQPGMATGESCSHMTHGTTDHVTSDTEPQVITMAQEPVFTSQPPGAPMPRVVTSQSAATKSSYTQSGIVSRPGATSGRSRPGGKGKVLTAKITGRSETHRKTGTLGPNSSLAPPMSSVIVERHQPVVKQTIGHATASKYPVNIHPEQTSIVHRKIAGQSGFHVTSPSLQSVVKVVE